MYPSKRMFKVLAVLLAFVLLWQAPTAFASTLSELKESQKQLEQKKNELNSSIKEKGSEINTIENEQTKLLTKIDKISGQIDETNGKIDSVNVEITKANDEITALEAEIVELQKKIDERAALLDERARAIQVSGNISYVDVLLGANSFVDFIDRFSAVSKLLDADRKIMREQKEDKLSLEDAKIVLEDTKKQLEADQAQLESLKASLGAQQQQMGTLVNQLEAEQAKLVSEKTLLEEEYSEALAISEENSRQIEAEQARLAEIARQEAIRKQKEAEAAKAAQSQNGGSSSSSNDGPAVSSGTWTKPANGRLTSPFGWRNLGSGNEFHYGIDIANSIGTTIVAANDGVISYAGSLSTYGNVVMITHFVNGSQWTTVYAHLNSINVSVGQSVDKGQKIGGMGNTGRSFGSHLHFEIHNGPWKSGRPHALNPLQYISM